MKRPLRTWRFMRAASLLGIAVAVALALVPAASESSIQNRLVAFDVPTNRGPLPACSGSDCGPANTVVDFVYVANANRLIAGGRTRENVPNAFLVSSVDESIFVDGVDTFDFTITPPPNAGDFSFWSGHWTSTVSCPPGSPPPCSVVGSPAVVPGENTAVLYTGWVHAASEPNGTYVFRYTVHGTLNGTPVDLTASGPPIVMTD
jgi:hypothetical protein